MNPFYRSAIVGAALSLAGSSGLAAEAAQVVQPAQAESSPVAIPQESEVGESFHVIAGGFLLYGIEGNLRLSNSDGQIGDSVDLVDTLGADSTLSVFRIDADWRFASRHRARFSYFDIKEETTRVLDKDIHWGDKVFHLNSTIDTLFRTTVYKVDYAYTFYRGEKNDFSATLGAHITRFETSIGLRNQGAVEGISATAPLPVFGLEWRSQLTDRFSLLLSGQYFGLSVDDTYSGNLTDILATVEYRVWRNWSLGGGFNYYRINADITKGPLTLDMTYKYSGILVFAGCSF